jgi:hypothetical protein
MNMKRINVIGNKEVCSTAVSSNPGSCESIAWGKINFEKTGGALVFAALLIVCSIAVGCSSDKPQSAASNNSSAMTQTPPVTTPTSAPAAPVAQVAAKPVHKKVRRAPVTLAYTDKSSGVTFQYPRKYSLKTGDAADQLVSSDPVPMDFVQPGGVAVAAVMVPETAYPKSDLASAFFNVSVNKALTAEQCGEFSESKPALASDAAAPAGTAAPAETTASAAAEPQPAKLMIGDMELLSSETVASQGTREEAAKYYHVFENGACYEFALKVTTADVGNQGGATHVDRGEVFGRLEKILASVKIRSVEDVAVSTPATATPTTAAATPAQ